MDRLLLARAIRSRKRPTCFVQRLIEELLVRYNAIGPQALGDLRRNNGASPSVLKPELLAELTVRLKEPPPDGGLWTNGKVAHWMAGELGLVKVGVQRGWEALKARGFDDDSKSMLRPAGSRRSGSIAGVITC